ncbi:hypothetical protein BVY00_01625, partial [bacterium G20]
ISVETAPRLGGSRLSVNLSNKNSFISSLLIEGIEVSEDRYLVSIDLPVAGSPFTTISFGFIDQIITEVGMY